jgi:transcriptional regulator with XRE-family HTH domain
MTEIERALSVVIERVRLEVGISKRGLGRAIDVEPTYVSHILAGRKVPSLGVFVRLAHALGVEPSDLLRAAEVEARKR